MKSLLRAGPDADDARPGRVPWRHVGGREEPQRNGGGGMLSGGRTVGPRGRDLRWIWGALACLSTLWASSGRAEPLFDRDIRPILKAACTHCHGEEEPIEGGVDLRLRRFLLADADSGEPVIVPGNPDASLLVRVVESGAMPQEGKPLEPAQIATLRAWIAAGAPTEGDEPESLPPGAFISRSEREHWAFLPIVDPPVPAVVEGDRIRTPLDAFLLEAQRPAGLRFADDADRETLIRRLSFDLTGLPPTPAEIDAFVHDSAPDAYKQLVERLLASPTYGQRWGRHWLDVAGYADSNGQVEADSLRPHAWRYRDYVVESLNADKPWDQFITEQLAGDELAGVVQGETTEAVLDPTRRELLIATGFLRTGPDGTGDGPPDPVLARHDVVAEQLKIVSSSLLGLTVGCAQCHDHRFDPITQADYYRLRAVFEPVFDTEQWRVPNQRLCSLATPEDREKAADIEKQAAEIDADAKTMEKQFLDEIFEKEIVKLPEEDREPYRVARATPQAEQTPEQQALLKKYPSALALYSLDLYDAEAQKKVAARRAEAAEIRKAKPVEEFLRVALELRDRVPATHVLHRGDPAQPKEEVGPGELTVLATAAVSPFEPAVVEGGSSGRRLAYARWLTSGGHPLVARVLVNRVWMHHFGEGIVASEGDFGFAGEAPSHPALLDWLASRFMANGWRLKDLHRLIVTSTAYRQQSRNRSSEKLDPENRLLARWQVQRLDAESIRDAMLAVSSRLSDATGGPAVNVGRDDLGRIVVGQEQYDGNGDIVGVTNAGEAAARRSLYVLNRRSTPLTSLATFDAPTMLPNCEQRISSTVAPQSLFMLNDTFVLETSQALAARLRAEHPGDLRAQVRQAWRLLTSHEASEDTVIDGLVHIAEQTESLRQVHAAAAAATPPAEGTPLPDPQAEAIASYCQVLLSSSRFLYVD